MAGIDATVLAMQSPNCCIMSFGIMEQVGRSPPEPDGIDLLQGSGIH